MIKKLTQALKGLEDEYRKCPVRPEMFINIELKENIDPLALAKSLFKIAKQQQIVIDEQQAVISALAKRNISLDRILCGNFLKPEVNP